MVQRVQQLLDFLVKFWKANWARDWEIKKSRKSWNLWNIPIIAYKHVLTSQMLNTPFLTWLRRSFGLITFLLSLMMSRETFFLDNSCNGLN